MAKPDYDRDCPRPLIDCPCCNGSGKIKPEPDDSQPYKGLLDRSHRLVEETAALGVLLFTVAGKALSLAPAVVAYTTCDRLPPRAGFSPDHATAAAILVALLTALPGMAFGYLLGAHRCRRHLSRTDAAFRDQLEDSFKREAPPPGHLPGVIRSPFNYTPAQHAAATRAWERYCQAGFPGLVEEPPSLFLLTPLGLWAACAGLLALLLAYRPTLADLDNLRTAAPSADAAARRRGGHLSDPQAAPRRRPVIHQRARPAQRHRQRIPMS
jgi:hypothetical protein